jgi:hypothetical protein
LRFADVDEIDEPADPYLELVERPLADVGMVDVDDRL